MQESVCDWWRCLGAAGGQARVSAWVFPLVPFSFHMGLMKEGLDVCPPADMVIFNLLGGLNPGTKILKIKSDCWSKQLYKLLECLFGLKSQKEKKSKKVWIIRLKPVSVVRSSSAACNHHHQSSVCAQLVLQHPPLCRVTSPGSHPYQLWHLLCNHFRLCISEQGDLWPFPVAIRTIKPRSGDKTWPKAVNNGANSFGTTKWQESRNAKVKVVSIGVFLLAFFKLACCQIGGDFRMPADSCQI